LICPSCGLENKPDATYCDDCGAVLAEAAAAPAGRRAPLPMGSTLGERYTIESGEARGPLNVYEALRSEDGARVRLIEDAEPAAPFEPPADAASLTAPADEDDTRAARIYRSLKGAESAHVWEVNGYCYAEGRGFVEGAVLPGNSLHDHLGGDRLDAGEVQALGMSLLEGIDALHQRGYLHLGVQPGSIFVDAGGTVILDGYDRLVAQDRLPSMFSVIEGYSAPEAYGVGGMPGPASDVFGVGAILYYAVSRRAPTEVSREQFFVFPPLSATAPDTPPDLERVIMKALSKTTANRWASAGEMLQALSEASLEPARVPVGVGAASAAAQETKPTRAAAPMPSAPSQPPAVPLPQTFLPYDVGMKSHVGCVRSVNQDSMLVMSFAAWERSIPTSALLCIVADGMGGEAEGDKASSLAIRSMAEYVLRNNIPIVTGAETMKLQSRDPVERMEELLRGSMEHANRTIFEYSQKDPSRRGMGSTLTSLMIDWPHAVFGHAGDTRAYLLGAELDQVTEDHSLVGKLVRLGQLTREEARNSPQRSYLYRAMGTAGELEIDVYSRRMKRGDRILICSDGVWEYFTDEEIVAYMQRSSSAQQTCEALIEETLRRGADDNCTAIVLHVP